MKSPYRLVHFNKLKCIILTIFQFFFYAVLQLLSKMHSYSVCNKGGNNLPLPSLQAETWKTELLVQNNHKSDTFFMI